MLKVKMDYPTIKEEDEILARMAHVGEKPSAKPVITAQEIIEARKAVNAIFADPKITQYILSIVFATREPSRFGLDLKGLIAYGASPRASIALTIASKAQALLQGRDYVTPQDVKALAHEILRHRIKPTYEAEAEDISSDEIIRRILEKIPIPTGS
jgi:MoxR-like ATPase